MEWTVTNAAGSVGFNATHTAHTPYIPDTGHTTHRTRSQDEHSTAWLDLPGLGLAWLD